MDKKETKKVNTAQEAKWYIINTYNGHEDRVKSSIEQMRASLSFEKFILDLKIVKRSEINPKTKKETSKNIYPGYVFIKAIMTDDVWYRIRNTNGVTGFIGSSGKGAKPIPLKEEEATRMIEQTHFNENKKAEYVPNFSIGDLVQISQGNWANNSGIVKSLDNSRGIAIVDVELFGRLMPIEIDYFSVIKK